MNNEEWHRLKKTNDMEAYIDEANQNYNNLYNEINLYGMSDIMNEINSIYNDTYCLKLAPDIEMINKLEQIKSRLDTINNRITMLREYFMDTNH
jgi:hypothetical protein